MKLLWNGWLRNTIGLAIGNVNGLSICIDKMQDAGNTVIKNVMIRLVNGKQIESLRFLPSINGSYGGRRVFQGRMQQGVRWYLLGESCERTAAVIHLVTQATAPCYELDDDVFDNPVDPNLLCEYLGNPSNALFVATIDGRVVGMISGLAYLHPDKPKTLFVNEVGVSDRYQRRGIGTLLLNAILEWGENTGCVEAWVATEAGNSVARMFYQATGGVEDDNPFVMFTYDLKNRFEMKDKE